MPILPTHSLHHDLLAICLLEVLISFPHEEKETNCFEQLRKTSLYASLIVVTVARGKAFKTMTLTSETLE